MGMTVHNEFNDIFETAGLIHLHYHPQQKSKEELVGSKDALTNRASMYDKFQPFLDRYVDVFNEYFISSKYDAFFFENAEEEWIAIVSILVKNSHWLTQIETLDEKEIHQAIVWHWQGDKTTKNIDEIVALLEEASSEGNFPFHVCWKWLLIFKDSKKYMMMLVEVINQNLQAYQKARVAIDKEVTPRLAQFKEPSKSYFEKFTNLVNLDLVEGNYEFCPTMINPFRFAMTQGCPIFCGLYLNEELAHAARKEKPKDVLAGTFKMLADQSKVEILSMLKEESMYNLQIAEKLGISAATTTHHMTNLLTRGFVSYQKREGKVYYSLEKGQIKEAIADLEAVFL